VQNIFSQTIVNDDVIGIIVEEVVKSLADEKKSPAFSDTPYSPIPLGVSNHHIHLKPETFSLLFGKGTVFEEFRPLYQPGEFASKHTLTIIGPKMRSIPNVRILGPLRDYDQVELTLTESIYLGIDAPYCNSGDLTNAAPLTLIGPKGSIYLEKTAIIASRHVHMSSKDADNYGVKSGDFCKIRIPGSKATIFENVLVRINDAWKLQMHLDTDDANAALVRGETLAEFMGKME
jgi:propanediol utilization protein